MLVSPGWNDVLPCDASVQRLYEALDAGTLDIPVDLVRDTGQRFNSLAEVAAVPGQQHGPILVDATMRMVNANHFKLAHGDAYHQTMLQSIGASRCCKPFLTCTHDQLQQVTAVFCMLNSALFAILHTISLHVT